MKAYFELLFTALNLRAFLIKDFSEKRQFGGRPGAEFGTKKYRAGVVIRFNNGLLKNVHGIFADKVFLL